MEKRQNTTDKSPVFNLKQIKKTIFEDRWVKFAFGPQGFSKEGAFNFGVVNFLKNNSSLSHSHDVGEALFVLSGNGVIKISEKNHNIKKNDFAFIPAGADHQIITRDKSIKILFIFEGKTLIKY
jgi:mannose-6-phosphate isomerase-like protein (cupin superfamily)